VVTEEGFVTLLRRYSIKPGTWEAFLEAWRKVAAIRQRHGFKIVFAFVDREANMFTWAISYRGSIRAASQWPSPTDPGDEAHAKYYQDPDRRQLDVIRQYITHAEVTVVECCEILEQ
jgi:hypothetical protein